MIKQLIRLAAARLGLASIGRALMAHGAEAKNYVAFAAILFVKLAIIKRL